MDPRSEMRAVRDGPGGAACSLETEQRPPVGKGKEGEGRGASAATFSKAAAAATQRAGRPDPAVKAQGTFGTNELADVAAR